MLTNFAILPASLVVLEEKIRECGFCIEKPLKMIMNVRFDGNGLQAGLGDEVRGQCGCGVLTILKPGWQNQSREL